ncbi:hypothetical protein HG531_004629 [Fusarium graminearum]|nr:hypothetical protein HG531_004629 [Fusarium graminearum]
MAGFCFAEVVTVPVESAASNKTSQEVVGTDGSTAADEEETHGCREKDPSLNKPVLQGLGNTTSKTTNLTSTCHESVGSGTTLSSLGASTRDVSMLNEVCCEHQEGKSEAVVGTGLGGNDLSERSSDVFIGKGTFCNGLGEDGIGAGDAGTDDESGEECDLWDLPSPSIVYKRGQKAYQSDLTGLTRRCGTPSFTIDKLGGYGTEDDTDQDGRY